jgi:hypothetical protein
MLGSKLLTDFGSKLGAVMENMLGTALGSILENKDMFILVLVVMVLLCILYNHIIYCHMAWYAS